MAVQMLYQCDLGGSALPQVFAEFDLADYLTDGASRLARGAEATAGVARQSEAAPSVARQSEAAPSVARQADAAPHRVEAKRPTRDDTAIDARVRRVRDAFDHAQELVRGTVDHREEIDGLIRQQADNWRLERMPAVDRNILRLAVFEMLYETEVPKLVVVDEAIELAKKYGSEHSGRFVNGLLDGLIKRHKFPGTLK
jgi:transcription antitermination factor NusB